MRESLSCSFHDIRRTFDALLMNLRIFTRYDRFAERRSPFARLRPKTGTSLSGHRLELSQRQLMADPSRSLPLYALQVPLVTMPILSDAENALSGMNSSQACVVHSKTNETNRVVH